jgi:hypothetical protein
MSMSDTLPSDSSSRGSGRSDGRQASFPGTRKKGSRKAGQPKVTERLFTPEKLEEMRDLWVGGATGATLARHFGCSRQTIHHHLLKVRKECRDNDADTLNCEIERIRSLQMFAWQNIRAQDGEETHHTIKDKILVEGGWDEPTADRIVKKIRHDRVVNWIGVVQWCISEVCKLKGYYLTRAEAEAKQEFRVAGQTREQITEKAALRFAEYVEKARNGEL